MKEKANAIQHADALAAIFEINGPHWFIAKADRDLDLYMKAESTEQWTDNLLNFSNALVSLEDWTFVGEQKDAARWRAGHRGACPEHALIALIALIGKHRDVSDGRYRSIRLQSINEIAVWTEEAVPGGL